MSRRLTQAGFVGAPRVASFTLVRPVDGLPQPIQEIRRGQGQVYGRSILSRAHSAVSVAAISGLTEALP